MTSTIRAGEEFEVSIVVDMKPTWHIYAPAAEDTPMIETETLKSPKSLM